MEINKSYYAIIPANVRYDSDLPANAKLLYGEITALCNEKGYCWAGDKYFSELYNVSKTSVQFWLKKLIEKGYLSKEIVYIVGTKQIDKRILRLPNQLFTQSSLPPTQENLHTPIQENLRPPIQENLRDNNTIKNNTSSSNDGSRSLKNLGVFSNIEEAISEMKKDGEWKNVVCKQSGVETISDFDKWIDLYKQHAIAYDVKDFNITQLKRHCFNWVRKRIESGAKLPIPKEDFKPHKIDVSHLQFH